MGLGKGEMQDIAFANAHGRGAKQAVERKRSLHSGMAAWLHAVRSTSDDGRGSRRARTRREQRLPVAVSMANSVRCMQQERPLGAGRRVSPAARPTYHSISFGEGSAAALAGAEWLAALLAAPKIVVPRYSP